MRQKALYCFTEVSAAATAANIDAPGGATSLQPRRARVVRHLGADDRSSARVRIVDGALRCLARQGIAKTTVDDMAREAGLSRATLYRTFPNGKEGVVAAVVETERARLFSSLAVVMGEAGDLEDVLVAGMVTAARWLAATLPWPICSSTSPAPSCPI